MKFIINIFFSLFFCFGVATVTSFDAMDSNVYICKGKYSKKYHYSKSCRGLSNCKSSVDKVTLSEAKKIGRTLCGWED
ncbi:hypothetical protein SAMN04489796_102196 [Winogradskyella thalassocola]|uniref:YARHG domain-containing protein n=1 Tax=Winogradskyella thalassocola TaxID=262004 RepID=A0A1G8B9A1_9FLAO|nr:hypothetical protein SAMN04489796_102196 [Winogradskyella thalassocola]